MEARARSVCAVPTRLASDKVREVAPEDRVPLARAVVQECAGRHVEERRRGLRDMLLRWSRCELPLLRACSGGKRGRGPLAAEGEEGMGQETRVRVTLGEVDHGNIASGPQLRRHFLC